MANDKKQEDECGNCRFWIESGRGRKGSGFCLRYPPIPAQREDGSVESFWPYVESDEWCGEHQMVKDAS